MRIYNGEARNITVVTDNGSVVIPAGEIRVVEVSEDALFNQSEFYVEEEGNWYIKTDGCYTGADVEIYDANNAE